MDYYFDQIVEHSVPKSCPTNYNDTQNQPDFEMHLSI